MAKKSQKPSKKDGTLIRGADGRLYFIPHSELEGYSVPDEGAAKTQTELDNWAAGEKQGALHAVPGRMVATSEVRVLPPGTGAVRKPSS